MCLLRSRIAIINCNLCELFGTMASLVQILIEATLLIRPNQLTADHSCWRRLMEIQSADAGNRVKVTINGHGIAVRTATLHLTVRCQCCQFFIVYIKFEISQNSMMSCHLNCDATTFRIQSGQFRTISSPQTPPRTSSIAITQQATFPPGYLPLSI